MQSRSEFQELLNVVDQILNQFRDHGLNIHEFELHLWRSECPLLLTDNEIPYLFSRIDRWVRHAIDSDVQRFALSLHNYGGSDGDKYALPQCVLLAKSVVTLTIQRCTIPPLSRDFKTNLPLLKQLTLHYVTLNGHLPENLFSSNLEEFTLDSCSGLKTINIFYPKKLKKLCVEDNRGLECVHIESLTLIEASFRGSFGYSLKVVDIRHCENLRCITMGHKTAARKWLDEGLTYYPVLETLLLHECDELKVAKISSTNLKSLKIFQDSESSSLTAIELNTPNLHEFTYHGGIVDFSSNASALASVSVDLRNTKSGNDVQESCDLKCIEFLSKLNGWGKVNLICSCEKFFIIPEELKEGMVSPLDDVKKLEITMTGKKPEPSEELIDSLFWISNHPAIQLLSRRAGYSSRFYNYTFKSSNDKTTSYEDEPSRIYFKGFQEMIKDFKR